MASFLSFVQRWFEESFTAPTPPQRDGWNAIASGRDTLIVAPTGSGKTLAAFLWALDHLHRLALDRNLQDRVYVVYVSPLRALNNDIEKNLRAPLAGIRAAAAGQGLELPEVRVAVRTGDTLAPARQAMTRRPPHILITTPESLYILLTSARFRPALGSARFVIVDEVHALMGGKRGAHLTLSLERLQALVSEAGNERPQRIGCSATVSPVERALDFLTGRTGRDPIAIDAGFTRALDLEVMAPVDDFLTATSDTIWDATLQEIAELVRAHRTTLVFAQSRRAAERLARNLDDLLEGGVAAHHGSLSRRTRLEAERRLKNGELRALVATSSLELGIDVGAIDLVIQLQSPRTIAAALQRVGRAGHLLTRISKGRIVVTKGDELIEAAAVVRAIRARRLDRIAVPEAPLDVLAQQVVASVAAESIGIDTLLDRFRNAAPYATLTRDDLASVVRWLAEPLPAEVRGAAPRILWDRVNDRLHARRGTRLLALTSGGTIPDAGLYDVFVADTDLKVGTLDEEFVGESLPGDVFLLGSHAWRIVKVRGDRVQVEDAQGMSPTIPFWKGEHPSRSFDLGVAVGGLRRDAAARLGTPEFEGWARDACGFQPRAADALRAWLAKAGELLGGIPDDRNLVVESFGDELGGRHFMIHSVFGMRVNGAWGMVLREALRRGFGVTAETGHVDDGVLLSFPPGQVPPSPGRVPTLVAPGEVDTLLGSALIGSPLFTARFRHAAVRALFIPRMHKGQRTPAWMQRLRADALMEAVGGQAEFPVVAETLRECFNDAFDVPRLKTLLEDVRDGEVRVRAVDTAMPSPFVYPLLLAWDWAYLDAGHAEERRTDAVVMRKAWSVPSGPLDAAAVAAVEAELQKRTPERRARDANELAAMLDELGDLAPDEIAERAAGDSDRLINELAAERRVAWTTFGERGAWVAATDAAVYEALGDDAVLDRIVLRLVRGRGPVTAGWFAGRYALEQERAVAALDRLERRGLLRRGAFLADGESPQYIHIAVLDEIQRRQAHARRVPRPVASPEQFTSSILRRHHLHPQHRLVGPPGVLAALELLQGEDVPVRLWEHALLPGRVESYEREWLDRLGLAGEIVWTCFGGSVGRAGVVLREDVAWLREQVSPPADLDPRTKNVLLHLQLRGACFVQELIRPTGLGVDQVLSALWELFWVGLVAPDTYSAILASATDRRMVPPATTGPGALRRPRSRTSRDRHAAPRAPIVGRWSAFADNEPLSPDDREEARAHLLLARYGVVARELCRTGWSTLRHALLRLELGGEVVRGYFVEGLSGEQYALPDALGELDRPAPRAEAHVLVNVADPANLWGSAFALTRLDGSRVSVPRLPHAWLVFRQGRPVLLAERQGQDLTALAGWQSADFPGAVRALQDLIERPAGLRPVRRLDVATWNGRPVRETDGHAPLLGAGFVAEDDRLVYNRDHAFRART